MWRFVLVLSLLAVAASERHKRLTTFGKAPEKATQATGKGRECNTDKDCLSQTLCKEDKDDGKRRCICGDGTYPVNGRCLHTREKLFRPVKRPFFPAEEATTQKPLFQPVNQRQTQLKIGLGRQCSASNECIQGAECKINPNTTQRYKVCMCEEDMVEEAGHCSGCGTINMEFWLLVTLGSLLLAGLHH